MQPNDRDSLAELATAAMRERGLEPEFPPAALAQLAALAGPAQASEAEAPDLSGWPWCSIDNDDSRDLDQLTAWQALPGGGERWHVAIADVDALVPEGTPLDAHARRNTTSVYTSARIFPMLPERLSTDWSSLNPGVARLALITSMDFDAAGELGHVQLQRGRVFNHARLSYDAVAAWLEGQGPLPAAAAAVPAMAEQLRRQDALAQRVKARRRERGALEFESTQPRAVFEAGQVVAIVQQPPNRARQLIQEAMVATNGATAHFLAEAGRPAIRRVVRSPERWARIVEAAADRGATLPAQPDGAALQRFLAAERARNPAGFADLSLVIVKLMGAGEYVVEQPGDAALGHFGLAVRDYTHSTAPNRRYPDLLTQRLIKAVLAGAPSPHAPQELAALARHCTLQEDAANKVERQMRKSEAALLLQRRLGDVFQGVVVGSANGNQWVRIVAPMAEGKIRSGHRLKVGQFVRARLEAADVRRGHLDFAHQP